jgi:hypothetical protein
MTTFLDWLQRYLKAHSALVGSSVTALVVAWFITSPHTITDAEWVLIITPALGAGGLTALSPANKPADTTGD